jgi:hypothetical protein
LAIVLRGDDGFEDVIDFRLPTFAAVSKMTHDRGAKPEGNGKLGFGDPRPASRLRKGGPFDIGKALRPEPPSEILDRPFGVVGIGQINFRGHIDELPSYGRVSD